MFVYKSVIGILVPITDFVSVSVKAVLIKIRSGFHKVS